MKTELIEEKRPEEEAGQRREWLVRIGCASQPLAPPLVVPLSSNRLILGRRDEEEARQNRIDCDDPWMSGEHAAIQSMEHGYELSDLGSSNGTLVWGRRSSRTYLHDGDIFETGATFWLFRSMVLTNEVPQEPAAGVLGSLHPTFIALASRLHRVARTKVPVMLLGSTGTGKEVLAKALHQASGRSGPFLAINTAAVQPNLIASELFGVEKGAHSTAEKARPGQIRTADGGTLLFDEIGDMPLEVQVSLLRVLQESEVVPVGGDSPVKVDVRVVCATHQDLQSLVDTGGFRSDLYARLKGCALEIPTLSDRPEDLGLLITRFLSRFGAEDLVFTPSAYRALVVYSYPLNVRELEKAVETAVAVCDEDRIELDHLPEEIRKFTPPALQEGTDDVAEASKERELLRLLAAHNGNVSAVARTMGRSRMQVHRWLKQLNVDPNDYR